MNTTKPMYPTNHPNTAQHLIDLESTYGAQNYSPLKVVLSHGQGAELFDVNGKCYIDMMSAYSAVSLGHSHPRILKVACEQIKQLGVVSRAYFNNQLGPFLQLACELSGQDKALPMNSGAEAVETALKAARKWGYTVKKVAPNKAEIIVCANNFHGRTITIISMSTETQYKNGFGPFPTGFTTIPFGDAAALEAAITPNTVAFLVEPIQGEAGIIVPPEGYLRQCAEICKRHNVLLMVDEIQSGLGRSGKLFAYQHDHIQPDALLLGKALGGGLLPVSLFLTRADVMNVFTPGDHGSTFGGNPLSAAVGFEALKIITEEKLAERSHELGLYFKEQLQMIKSPAIKNIRGRGLFIGVEINPKVANAHALCEALAEHGVLSKETHDVVIRLAPPLIITKAQLDQVIASLKAVLPA